MALQPQAKRIILPELDEIDFGPAADGAPLEDARRRTNVLWAAWAAGDAAARTPGGESLAEVSARLSAALSALVGPGGCAAGGAAVAVTHSALLRVLLAAALANAGGGGVGGGDGDWRGGDVRGWGLGEARGIQQENCCVNVLDFPARAPPRPGGPPPSPAVRLVGYSRHVEALGGLARARPGRGGAAEEVWS
jgi:hypothetical protein